MQAAANRSVAPEGAPSAAQTGNPAHVACADDPALLSALPIAAAIVGVNGGGMLKLFAHNPRFDEVIALSGDAAMMSGDFRNCHHLQIAELMSAFLADFDVAQRTRLLRRRGGRRSAFPDQAGAAAARATRADRAAWSAWSTGRSRCSAERTLRAEMLRDSLTGLPNRLAFTETIEARAGENGAARLRACGAGGRHAALFSRINESMGSLAGDELLITFARRLISALRGGRRAGPHRRQ